MIRRVTSFDHPRVFAVDDLVELVSVESYLVRHASRGRCRRNQYQRRASYRCSNCSSAVKLISPSISLRRSKSLLTVFSDKARNWRTTTLSNPTSDTRKMSTPRAYSSVVETKRDGFFSVRSLFTQISTNVNSLYSLYKIICSHTAQIQHSSIDQIYLYRSLLISLLLDSPLLSVSSSNNI